MKMIEVTSKNLTAVGYEQPEEWLFIDFKHGGKYRFSGVPASTYNQLMAAESKGTFFNEHIKDRYKFVRLK